jgi:hypothetical protein
MVNVERIPAGLLVEYGGTTALDGVIGGGTTPPDEAAELAGVEAV